MNCGFEPNTNQANMYVSTSYRRRSKGGILEVLAKKIYMNSLCRAVLEKAHGKEGMCRDQRTEAHGKERMCRALLLYARHSVFREFI